MDVHDIRPIDRHEMVGLATTEYERLLALLRDLDDDDWGRPTACDAWSVADMVAHLLGAAEGNASMVENTRQLLRGRRRAHAAGRPLVDGVNDVQVADRRHLAPAELTARLERAAPRAVRGRRRTPGPLRRMRVASPLGGTMTLGFLVDVIYTRDEWMHRIDIARATGREIALTPEHDGRIVADVVREWALAHREPFALELTGPAGGAFHQGTAGADPMHIDAVEFCLAISGRAPAGGLLAVQVLF